MVRRLPDPAYRVIGSVLTHPRFHPIHRRLYLWTGGRGIVGHGLGVDMLLLHTTGRSSGRPRTVPLAAVPDGDAWVVVGSFGGRDRDPGWIHNLRAEPRGKIQVRGKSWHILGREADPAEAARLWPIVEAAYPGYATYRAATVRAIPLMVLRPAAEGERP